MQTVHELQIHYCPFNIHGANRFFLFNDEVKTGSEAEAVEV